MFGLSGAAITVKVRKGHARSVCVLVTVQEALPQPTGADTHQGVRPLLKLPPPPWAALFIGKNCAARKTKLQAMISFRCEVML